MTTPARTRIAPSPTGYMHIGTLRTSLFDYFLSKQTGGKFIIRIEDTDQERLVEGATESLLATFSKLGILHDEGPFLQDDGSLTQKGDVGPYIQSERLDIYRPYVETLLGQGDAYPCFCSRERLTEMREEQRATKQTPKYDRACLALGQDEVTKRLADGEAHVIRMKVPEGQTVFEDVVRGTVSVNNSDLDDQVLMKSDGFPTYHMAVVVDDNLMAISHVLRGEEWIPSTPKHVILMNMLGFDVPTFAHVPLLLNADKTKLSKRQGDVAVEDYLEKGYLPAALINFVGTLGFNPTGDREVYTLQELIDMFDLSKVKKSGAVMNIEKLDWMNQQYLKELGLDEVAEAARPFVEVDVDDPMIMRALFVERERIHRLTEFAEAIVPYTGYDAPDAETITWKKSDAADAKVQLEGVRAEIAGAPDDIYENLSYVEDRIKAYIEKNELSNGNVLWPLRIALSGLQKSASPFEFLWVLGREESLKRIDQAIAVL
ncbi:glutamate--tRNA ligase [Candidatus Uhrbacteria bacterium]|jgi:nondiscriminating glutamyl-tRNA synthetase|nr:glutamate--tRNA ligase [Candidatus Uhrbacteria bacterium]